MGNDQNFSVKLKFMIHRKDGIIEEQELSAQPTDESQMEVIKSAMMQYAVMGVLRKDGRKFRLGPLHHDIDHVECEMPSIFLADLSQLSKLVSP